MNVARLAAALGLGLRLIAPRRDLRLLIGLVITDRCNLGCFYCQSRNAGEIHATYEEVRLALGRAYARGHRLVYFTGGEPTLWGHGERLLADLVEHALDLGFLQVLIYTNGTRPLDIPGASYMVTLDGPRPVHDRIRGGTFDLIMRNVAAAATRSIHATITFNRLNAPCVEEFVRDVSSSGLFRGISFNLLTGPPSLVGEHGLSSDDRVRLLDDLWRLKRAGHPILLSRAAYVALRTNRWNRPIPAIELWTPRRLFTCCRDVGRPSVCAACGYSGCAEVSQILALRPSTLWQGVRMLAG